MEIIIKQKNKMTIYCPICNKEIESNKNIIDQEFSDLNCDNCSEFIYILCEYCNKKIFYKKNNNKDNSNNNLLLNGMNGVNIKCPYSSCGKYFYLTICPKCKRNQKIRKVIKEGDLIKCKEEKRCGYEYLQIRCPRKDCNDITYFAKPKNFCNSPNGILYHHKKIIFQKISCTFCFRPICYNSEENKINRYFDSMKIECPYEDCKKIFNRIICPICSEINIIEGAYYIMGHKLKCIRCKNCFGKILCPNCLKINPLTKSFFKTGPIICSYTACAKESTIINCIHCLKMNVFNDKNKLPIPGQQIECCYEDCGKVFNEVYCPGCNELNPFPEGNFSFGKAYKCLYSFCQKTYQFFVCPNCFTYSATLEPQEGKKYICNNCNILLSNWKCPFCESVTMDKDSKLIYGQMVKCPHCQKKYSFCRCYVCQKMIFSEENNYILGRSIICKSCEKYSVNVVCTKCNAKISFLERMDDIEDGEKIKCGNCNKEFEFKKQNEENIDEKDIYSQNLSILGKIKGESIHFGKSQMDDNYLYINNLFIQNKIYNDKPGEKNDINLNENSKKKNIFNLCILCHCDMRESVFYPCGHKVTCYKCTVVYFQMHKKCPRCNHPAEAFIPKVYEQFYDKDEKEEKKI